MFSVHTKTKSRRLQIPRPNRRIKAAFTNTSGVLLMGYKFGKCSYIFQEFYRVLTFRLLCIILQLRTTKRVYNLMCESRRDAEVWVEKLQNMNV